MSGNGLLSSPLRVIPKTSTKVLRSDRARAEIQNAAFDFIWSYPFRDLNVNLLMAKTNMGRSAFYQYYSDLHELMEVLLDILQNEIFLATRPYFKDVGDPVGLLNESLAGLVHIGYERGPFLRAISDSATTDKRFEKAWTRFLTGFDDAVVARIEADQEQGLTPVFDARPVAVALNRLDAYSLIHAFGTHPRSEPEPVQSALSRIWISTVYGSEWLGKESSDLVRKWVPGEEL